jgi:AcrR family transcriptional regulator
MQTADLSTEEKIIDAARRIFTQKGFLATTVRDIAAEADINIASINYYFRSKEKLFAVIMDETIKKMFDRIEPALNDETTSLIEKVEICVGYYIDQVLENPDFPFFMVNEVMAGKTTLPTISNMRQLVNSHFAKQLKALQTEGTIAFQPVHLLWNLLGMIIFPILTRPQVLHMNYFNADEFRQMMQERKKLIPVWVNMMISSSKDI